MIQVVKKEGYTIFAQVNPITKKLFNFSIKGDGVNPKTNYAYIIEAENFINFLIKKKENERINNTMKKLQKKRIQH